MKIKTRKFTYPVITQSDNSLFFNGVEFSMTINSVITENEQTIFNIDFTCNDHNLIKLVENDKAEIVALVECPSCRYRNRFKFTPDEVNKKHKEFSIKSELLDASCEVSLFICAKDNIKDYQSSMPSELLKDDKFDIQINDILAFDEVDVQISHEDFEKKTKSSIFGIQKNTDGTNCLRYTYDNSAKIYIHLPQREYERYSAVEQKMPKQTMIAMLCLPALTYALTQFRFEMLNGGEELESGNTYAQEKFDEMHESCKWFRNIEKTYKKINKNKKELRIEDFCSEDSPLLLAQNILNNVIINTFTSIYEFEWGGEDDE